MKKFIQPAFIVALAVSSAYLLLQNLLLFELVDELGDELESLKTEKQQDSALRLVRNDDPDKIS